MSTAIPIPVRTHASKPVHGVTLGIIILDTRFQRVPGDVGYAGSFSFPVQYYVAKGYRRGSSLSPDQPDVLDAFVKAAQELVSLGVSGIGTSCGFLSIFQPYFIEKIGVPVATSSLLQIPLVERLLPKGRQVGVLTANAAYLTREHFIAAGARADIPLAGISPDGVFHKDLSDGNPHIDRAAHERDVLAAVAGLLAANPSIGALVLECTNLSPYSAAIERTFGVPVYDVITMLEWFHSGLRPRRRTTED